jgi:hypothetical protein
VPVVLGLLGAAAIMAGLVVVLVVRGQGRPVPTGDTVRHVTNGSGSQPADDTAGAAEGSSTALATPEETEPDPAARRYLVVDTGRMPWAPPTHGPRPRLDYLPPGSQLILLARPAELLASDEGRLLIRGLGSAAETWLDQLATWCGCMAADIELVQAGWQAGGPDQVIGGVAVRLVAGRRVPSDEVARAAAWGPTKAANVEGETYFTQQGLSFWAPSGEDNQLLVVVSEPAADDSSGPAGLGSPLIMDTIHVAVAARDRPQTEIAGDLPRDLAVLTGMLDADRHLTLFGSPHFLFNRGRLAFAGPLAKLFKPLQWFFGDEIRAAGLSIHVADSCYLELDAVTPVATPPRKEAPELFARLGRLPSAVEEYEAALNPSPYGRILVLRLPSMLRQLVANARWAPEGEGIVINAYLPRHAPHNLAVAAELILAQAPGAVAVAEASPATSAADVRGKLDRPITIVFPKDTLETAVQMVADQTGVSLEIGGPDLQLEGITKNQSFGLDERDTPARDVLLTILSKANPDGKLVYVIRQGGAVETVLITTRAAAAKRGDALPPEFNSPPKQ